MKMLRVNHDIEDLVERGRVDLLTIFTRYRREKVTTEPEQLVCEIMQLSLSTDRHLRARRSIEQRLAQRARDLQAALPRAEDWRKLRGVESETNVRAVVALSAFTRWLGAFADVHPMVGEALAARIAADILLGVTVLTSRSFTHAVPSLKRRIARLRALAESGRYFERRARRPSEEIQHRARLLLQQQPPDPLNLTAEWIEFAL